MIELTVPLFLPLLGTNTALTFSIQHITSIGTFQIYTLKICIYLIVKDTCNYMFRHTFLFLFIFLNACSQDDKGNPKIPLDHSKKVMIDTTNNEYKLTARFNSFDTMVEVLFVDTKDSISKTQNKNYEGFIAKQDLLTPEILKKIFDFYKNSYSDYKEGWTMSGGTSDKELEKHLPTPMTPEKLKAFITPAIVHIQNKEDCKEGTIGIEFDCTWDIENGLGVNIRNWKVVQVGSAEVAYF